MTRLATKIAALGIFLGLAAGPIATLLAAEPDPVPGVTTRYFETPFPFFAAPDRQTETL